MSRRVFYREQAEESTESSGEHGSAVGCRSAANGGVGVVKSSDASETIGYGRTKKDSLQYVQTALYRLF